VTKLSEAWLALALVKMITPSRRLHILW
jgi:hypothetical protein